MQKFVISLLVDNVPGVLSRISGLFSRRAYNIESITAGVTANPRITRLTIVSSGDEQVLEQIVAQLDKQVDVRNIKVLQPDNSVVHELILVKIMADENQREKLITIANIFRAKIVDVQKDCIMLELTGSQEKLAAFLEMCSTYKIAELARTGLAGLARGSDDIRYF